MTVILGRIDTYSPELMEKLSKLDLALIYVRHGGDIGKVAAKWQGADDYLKNAATGDPESSFILDKRIRSAGLDSVVGGAWTKKKIISMIGKLIED